jgi:hypothetical protein
VNSLLHQKTGSANGTATNPSNHENATQEIVVANTSPPSRVVRAICTFLDAG